MLTPITGLCAARQVFGIVGLTVFIASAKMAIDPSATGVIHFSDVFNVSRNESYNFLAMMQ
jgi:hypothetical protein